MTDEEFDELKRKVANEEQRRRSIQAKKEYLEYIEKGFGLQQPNGWCRNMNIKIIQDVDMLQGVDGNGGIEHRHYEANLNEKECDLLFRAFEEMAIFFEKDIERLDEDKQMEAPLTETQQAIEDKLELLAILKKGWFTIIYDPVIKCHHISFDIYDDEAFKKVDRWLHPARYKSEDK